MLRIERRLSVVSLPPPGRFSSSSFMGMAAFQACLADLGRVANYEMESPVQPGMAAAPGRLELGVPGAAYGLRPSWDSR